MSGGGGAKQQKSQAERDQANLAEEQWNDYQARFVPLENHYIGKLNRIRDDRNLATGRANADVSQAYDASQNGIQAHQFASGEGINPNSGRYTGSLADLSTARATGLSSAMTAADQNTENRYYAGQGRLVALGQGQSSDANVGFNNLAGLESARERSEAYARQARTDANYNAAGTVIGMGASAYMHKPTKTPTQT